MWLLFSLLAALSAACAITLSKAGLKKVDPSLAFAVQAILIIIITWSVVFFQKKTDGLAKMDQHSWLFLILAGVMTCLSSLFQFNALKLGNASIVSSIERSSLVFTIIFAIIFLKEEVNWKIITGAMLMIGGALMITLSQKTD